MADFHASWWQRFTDKYQSPIYRHFAYRKAISDLKSNVSTTYSTAIQTLVELGDQRAVYELIKKLSDERYSKLAARAIRDMGVTDQQFNYLVNMLDTNIVEKIRSFRIARAYN